MPWADRWLAAVGVHRGVWGCLLTVAVFTMRSRTACCRCLLSAVIPRYRLRRPYLGRCGCCWRPYAAADCFGLPQWLCLSICRRRLRPSRLTVIWRLRQSFATPRCLACCCYIGFAWLGIALRFNGRAEPGALFSRATLDWRRCMPLTIGYFVAMLIGDGSRRSHR